MSSRRLGRGVSAGWGGVAGASAYTEREGVGQGGDVVIVFRVTR